MSEDASERGGPEAGTSRGGRWGKGLVIALVALLALGLAWQVREGQRMASRVQVLEGDLAEARSDLQQARSELAAHRQERAQVRQRLGAVRGQIEALESLLGEPPATPSAP